MTVFQLFSELTIFNMSLTRCCAMTRINESLHNSLRIDGCLIFFLYTCIFSFEFDFVVFAFICYINILFRCLYWLLLCLWKEVLKPNQTASSNIRCQIQDVFLVPSYFLVTFVILSIFICLIVKQHSGLRNYLYASFALIPAFVS